MKLALGTAQFGLPYGVANTVGQVNHQVSATILKHARLAGLDTLDTAIGYGDSEQRLGEAEVSGWRVISKLPGLPDICPDVDAWVRGQVSGSLSRLRVKSLTGLLLHRPHQLLETNGKKLWGALQNLQREGVIEKIGFSIYEPSEIDGLWCTFQPDLVQTPYNILDRRLVTSGWLERLNKAGVEVHVRSIFLQGLLLMNAATRPKKFERWAKVWSVYDSWLKENKTTALSAALAFALADPRIARVIIGVDTLAQFEEILLAANTNAYVDDAYPTELSLTDHDLLNPSRWHLL